MKKQGTVSTRLRRFIRGGLAALVITGLLASPATYADNYWVELGECVVDYTSWLPDWLENWVDDVIAGDWNNNLDPEHPDAYLKVFTSSSENTQVGSTIYRGFYAQGNEPEAWKKKMKAWFLEKKRVVYVNGVILDKESRNNCSVHHRDYVWSGGWFTDAGMAKLRFDSGTSYQPNYHLFARNCQHFKNWVLTGTDNSL